MFDFLTSGLIGTSAGVVNLLGKVVETIGEISDNETLKDMGKTIQENDDLISK